MAKEALSSGGLPKGLGEHIPTDRATASASKLAGNLQATLSQAAEALRGELTRDFHSDGPLRVEWLGLLRRFEQLEPDERSRLRSWRQARKSEGLRVRGLLAIETPTEDEMGTLRDLLRRTPT